MSNKNPGKFFYYPAPPPHIINYFLIFVKHFLALFFGQIFWLKKNKISCKRQAFARRSAWRTPANEQCERAKRASRGQRHKHYPARRPRQYIIDFKSCQAFSSIIFSSAAHWASSARWRTTPNGR